MKIHPMFERLLSEGLFRNREGWPTWSEWTVAGKPVVVEEEHVCDGDGVSSSERLARYRQCVVDLKNEIAQKDAKIRELEKDLRETRQALAFGWEPSRDQILKEGWNAALEEAITLCIGHAQSEMDKSASRAIRVLMDAIRGLKKP